MQKTKKNMKTIAKNYLKNEDWFYRELLKLDDKAQHKYIKENPKVIAGLKAIPKGDRKKIIEGMKAYVLGAEATMEDLTLKGMMMGRPFKGSPFDRYLKRKKKVK